MTQLYKPKSSIRKAESDNLFSGIWIRWQALTVGERFVCANIVLLPVWWLAGLYPYMSVILLLSVVLYEFRQHGELRLKRPSLPVITLFVFGAYEAVRPFFFLVGVLGGIKDALLFTFIPTCLLWYIQSKNIRIRMEVVAWACTVSVVQMLGLWLLIQFVLPDSVFFPPRLNLFARIAGEQEQVVLDELYNADAAFDLNNLVPYAPKSNGMLGFDRFSMFFAFPEFFGFVAGFIGILALDIRSRLWSWLLFLACVFLIVLSATRIVVVVFPIVVCLYYVLSNFRKLWGPPIIFALMAVVSFTSLSIPQTSNLLFGQITDSAQTVNQVRANSTQARLEIYKHTLKAIQEKPLLGYRRTGDYLPYPAAGTHSVILGNLMFKKGLVGTAIFTFFWISLFIWFYKTRAERPLTCFCVWTLYTLASPTLQLIYEMPISPLLILLCAAIHCPKLKSAPNSSLFKKLHHA